MKFKHTIPIFNHTQNNCTICTTLELTEYINDIKFKPTTAYYNTKIIYLINS